MIDFAAQLSTLYARVGEPVTPAVGDAFFGVVSFEAAGFDLGAMSRVTLRFPFADAPGLVEGDALTVRGLQWQCAEDPQPIGDGLEASVALHRV